MKTNYKKSILILLSAFACNNAVNAQSIAAGGWHSLTICADSTVKGFGENATGQVGNGNSTDQSTPVTVSGLTGIIAVSGGGDQVSAHSMALKGNGTVWCWGSNLYGALGNASTTGTFVTAPVQALVLSNAKTISAGGWHSAALKNDGTVWTWGWNLEGQLGDGSTTDKTVPTQVPSLSGVIKIAAGTYHTLALKNDGTVWAWGDNLNGQVGNGTNNNDVLSPVQVSGLTNVVSIAAGRFFSLAVKNDGTVWTWGENLYGQLGNGNTTDQSTPVQVSGLTGITSAVAATGAFHCMAYKNNNTVWSWGRNTYGNLGDNTITNSSVPVQMIGISNVTGMAAGTNFSLVYKTDGTFWGCGRNASGQLGIGNTVQQNTLAASGVICSILQPVGIEDHEELSSAGISVFPNPSTSGKFTLELRNGVTLPAGKIEIYNSIGEKVYELITIENMNTPHTIDLSLQADGIYYLTLKSGERTFYRKLIMQ